jgi:hypothetical protein
VAIFCHQLAIKSASFCNAMMTEPSATRKPRFEVGDHVRAIGPSVGVHEGRRCTVSEIIGLELMGVFRYRVTFEDDHSEIFYGFELEPVEQSKS